MNVVNLSHNITTEINNLCSIVHFAHNDPRILSLKERLKWLIELKLKILKKGHCSYCNYKKNKCRCANYCTTCHLLHNGTKCDRNIMNSNIITTIMLNITQHLYST